MRDVIWTIIAVWVVYQIYKVIKSSRVYVYQKHEHHYNTTKEGEVKIDQQKNASDRRPNSDKGGEYVDFEEIKD
ncbi:MAG TPA: hypothetical protein VNZ49_03830 [Bacteroidia bacterium]|jgi:hypothetical protein|nr:hypothetical protein [Bacteroidia bacterium]